MSDEEIELEDEALSVAAGGAVTPPNSNIVITYDPKTNISTISIPGGPPGSSISFSGV